MDDFLLASQSNDLPTIRTILFHCIDQLLRPLCPADSPYRKEPNSVSKLKKGDACWSTVKIILGWKVDTVARTIELPSHRVERLRELLASIPHYQRRTSTKKWQSLIGELRSMVLAIPSGIGLFTQLQSVLTSHTLDHRLILTEAVHHQLDDLRWLVAELTSRPTRWGEIVDSDPAFLGSVDASGTGMGGVWIHTQAIHNPIIWRQRFPPSVTARLVTTDLPSGDLTNSDLEHAALTCHPHLLAQLHDIRELTVAAMSDNTAAVSRESRGSTSVDAPAAYLCRLSALNQRRYRYRLQPSYIPGPLNVMADILSRRWDLSDPQLLLLFNSQFPQATPWIISPLEPSMNSAVTLALSMHRCPLEFPQADAQWLVLTSATGQPSVNNMSWTATSPLAPIQSRGFKSSLPEFEMAGFRPAATLSDLAQWRMRSTLWHRRSPCWVPPTPATRAEQETSIPDSSDS